MKEMCRMTIQDLQNLRATCPQCETQYPFRKSKIYCSPNCRKAASRGIQNSRTSKAKARDNYEFFDTARRMGETLYSLPLSQRLGHMKELIDEARAGNTARIQLAIATECLRPRNS